MSILVSTYQPCAMQNMSHVIEVVIRHKVVVRCCCTEERPQPFLTQIKMLHHTTEHEYIIAYFDEFFLAVTREI